MQLTQSGKTKREVGAALAAATCSLLSNGQAFAQGAKEPGSWDFDVAVLYYGESDGRVQALEPVINATRSFDDETSLNLKAV